VIGSPRSTASSALHAVGRLHGDGGARRFLAQMLFHLGDHVDLSATNVQGVVDRRKMAGLETPRR